eukprot:15473835-Alexandrium_andersonii.AAC.1
MRPKCWARCARLGRMLRVAVGFPLSALIAFAANKLPPTSRRSARSARVAESARGAGLGYFVATLGLT